MPPKPKLAEAAAPSVSEDDIAMEDGPVVDPAQPTEDENDPARIAFTEQRIRILPGSSEYAASFEFQKEDHTLGNALRYIIMKNPDVEFCGYSIPHPSEELMNIRIQTYEPTPAVDALEKGLNDLIDLCDVVTEKFHEAQGEYGARMET